MTLNSFDRIVPFYDRLARLVFGMTIREAQKYFLNEVQPKEKVLILGGGTGWILVELFKITKDCEVCYIDASEKMIAYAREKCGSPNVHFIHGTEDDIPTRQFDVVITNFYLDLFNEGKMQKVIEKIGLSLKEGSRWIVTDFLTEGKWWQDFMLKVMYIFFQITCRIEADRLANWQKALNKNGFSTDRSMLFYGGFIKSGIYQAIG